MKLLSNILAISCSVFLMSHTLIAEETPKKPVLNQNQAVHPQMKKDSAMNELNKAIPTGSEVKKPMTFEEKREEHKKMLDEKRKIESENNNPNANQPQPNMPNANQPQPNMSNANQPQPNMPNAGIPNVLDIKLSDIKNGSLEDNNAKKKYILEKNLEIKKLQLEMLELNGKVEKLQTIANELLFKIETNVEKIKIIDKVNKGEITITDLRKKSQEFNFKNKSLKNVVQKDESIKVDIPVIEKEFMKTVEEKMKKPVINNDVQKHSEISLPQEENIVVMEGKVEEKKVIEPIKPKLPFNVIGDTEELKKDDKGFVIIKSPNGDDGKVVSSDISKEVIVLKEAVMDDKEVSTLKPELKNEIEKNESKMVEKNINKEKVEEQISLEDSLKQDKKINSLDTVIVNDMKLGKEIVSKNKSNTTKVLENDTKTFLSDGKTFSGIILSKYNKVELEKINNEIHLIKLSILIFKETVQNGIVSSKNDAIKTINLRDEKGNVIGGVRKGTSIEVESFNDKYFTVKNKIYLLKN